MNTITPGEKEALRGITTVLSHETRTPMESYLLGEQVNLFLEMNSWSVNRLFSFLQKNSGVSRYFYDYIRKLSRRFNMTRIEEHLQLGEFNDSPLTDAKLRAVMKCRPEAAKKALCYVVSHHVSAAAAERWFEKQGFIAKRDESVFQTQLRLLQAAHQEYEEQVDRFARTYRRLPGTETADEAAARRKLKTKLRPKAHKKLLVVLTDSGPITGSGSAFGSD